MSDTGMQSAAAGCDKDCDNCPCKGFAEALAVPEPSKAERRAKAFLRIWQQMCEMEEALKAEGLTT